MSFYSSYKALVIGIGRYADPKLDLSYARSDAESMAELLRDEFGFGHVWTLYDEQATRQQVIDILENDLQQTDSDDGVVIFFAGHGITVTSAMGDERGFLVPHDGQLQRPYSNIPLSVVRDEYLWMLPAKHVFLIVDACYGGLAHRDVLPVSDEKTIDEEVLSELTRRDRKVRQVLSAGAKDQKVLDGGLFGRSVFTGRLIEAMREANPYMTADRLGLAVRDRVSRDSLDRGHRQVPQFGCLVSSDGSFVFHRQPPAVVRDGQPQTAHPDRERVDVGTAESAARENADTKNSDVDITDRVTQDPSGKPQKKPKQSRRSKRRIRCIFQAVQEDDVAAIERLISFDSNAVNQLSDAAPRIHGTLQAKSTPLHLAVRNGNERAVELLLRHGSDPNARNAKGKTALHIAAMQGESVIARCLIDVGADRAISDDEGQTAFDVAQRCGHPETSHVLQIHDPKSRHESDKPNKPPKPKISLHEAAQKGDLEQIRRHVAHGTDVNAADSGGLTPLHLAAHYGHAEAIRSLYKAGANFNAKQKFGATPLHIAVEQRHIKVINTLADAGADINAKRCNNGRTSLHIAAQNVHVAAVKALIRANADVNVKDNDGETPLHKAAIRGHAEAIETLIQAHAEVNAKDAFGKTPLHDAAMNGQAAAIEALIQANADVNAKDNIGGTPLHNAARDRHTEAIKALIQANADVNAKDDIGRTPLHSVARCKQAAAIEALIQANADVNAKDRSRDTPLHCATEASLIHGDLMAIEALIQANADINAKNSAGDTPLRIATEKGHAKAIEVLRRHGAR